MAFVPRLGSLIVSIFSVSMLVACADEGGGDESQSGQPGEPCLGGTFCNEGLICSDGICLSTEVEEAEEAGDSTSDGDTTGDGDTTSDSTTGPVTFGLYEGPCTATEECPEGSWCAESYGFCSLDCTVDADCPTYPGATAIPQCQGFFSEVQGNSKLGCALECEDASECPEGTQCWAVGVSTWCGY